MLVPTIFSSTLYHLGFLTYLSIFFSCVPMTQLHLLSVTSILNNSLQPPLDFYFLWTISQLKRFTCCLHFLNKLTIHSKQAKYHNSLNFKNPRSARISLCRYHRLSHDIHFLRNQMLWFAVQFDWLM